MPLDAFKQNLDSLRSSLRNAKSLNLNVNKTFDQNSSFYNYKTRREEYLIGSLKTGLANVKKSAFDLALLNKYSTNNELKVHQIIELVDKLKESDTDLSLKVIDKIYSLVSEIKAPEKINSLNFKLPVMPESISGEIATDVRELEKCYDSECYRSCVIICGRILEVALHKFYHNLTDVDLLEKSPGIGLGNLLAKLNEKGAEFAPGLTQQIHLINQVRVFSVHKKKEIFSPGKEQTTAIILYTLDVLKKIKWR